MMCLLEDSQATSHRLSEPKNNRRGDGRKVFAEGAASQPREDLLLRRMVRRNHLTQTHACWMTRARLADSNRVDRYEYPPTAGMPSCLSTFLLRQKIQREILPAVAGSRNGESNDDGRRMPVSSRHCH